MRVTRSWLEEFIDLSDISNARLYEVFNAIGLEVDTLKEIMIPDGVVVGKILSCEKHPDADKLNVCQIDIGEGVRQIVCGAANVREATYVAVATVGSTLPGNFLIKPAELRGVKSDGMVCSSNELGLPKINDGIMILDESIGILDIGKELSTYPKVADTMIELELTANRGDCLSIHGVARDLCAALGKDMKPLQYPSDESSEIAIARKFNINNQTDASAGLLYKLSQSRHIGTMLLIQLRLAFVEIDLEESITNLLRYSTHATGVILRAYDSVALRNGAESVSLLLESSENSLPILKQGSKILSTIGVNQTEDYRPDEQCEEILFEASYIPPQIIIEGVANSDIVPDSLFYNTSRGSEPDLALGMAYLESQCYGTCDCVYSDSMLTVESQKEPQIIAVSFDALDHIIGQTISKSKASGILSRLGFGVHRTKGAESFGVTVPAHRHDIVHLQDIAEEILRMIGINNIKAKPLELTEKIRLTESTLRHQAKRDIRLRAVGRGFFEAVTYAFCDQTKLERYGFPTTKASQKLLNPIAEEFNSMRSTLLINLLDAVKRNASYGIKRIPLFEIGTVFTSKKQESEKIAFVWSGHAEPESVSNHGKACDIDFSLFTEHLGVVAGSLTFEQCGGENGLMHPYQSAHIIKENKIIGFVSKLHPSVAETYGIPDTFISEMDLEALLPKHIIAVPVSNYQGVYKDLSLVVEETLPFSSLAQSITQLPDPLLKRFYPVDIYQDDTLEGQKSITVRFFIQSSEETLSDATIEGLMQKVLTQLEAECGAVLR